MADNKNVIFRNSLKGYNKSDVNSYLLKMTEDFEKKEKELRDRLTACEKELSAASEKLSAFDEANDETETLKLRIKELEEAAKNAEAEKNSVTDDKYNAAIAEKQRTIDEQNLKIESLTLELEELKKRADADKETVQSYEETVKKARMYEKTSANIGDVIISANRTADEIVFAAKEKARIIYEESEKAAEERRREVSEASKRALDGIFSKFRAAALENRESAKATREFASRKTEEVLLEIEAREAAEKTRLDEYEKNLWQDIRDDVNSIRFTSGIGSMGKDTGKNEHR